MALSQSSGTELHNEGCSKRSRKNPFGIEAFDREISCGFKIATKVDDPLPWRNIDIDNDTITDDDLLRLTDRARGYVNSLRLVECKNITASGLKRVFLSNPWLSEVAAVLKGETITVNRNGYAGWFEYRESQREVTASRPFNDPTSTSSGDETDPFGMDWREGAFAASVLDWIYD